MKIFFLKDDSLYKIFKSINKFPKNKKIEIYIESNSQLFEHERRGLQIKELIEKQGIDIVFVTKSDKSREYYKKVGLNFFYNKENHVLSFLKVMYLFFFNVKKIHLDIYTKKKNYIFYLTFFVEIFALLIVVYFVYGLIIPSTNITIRPNYQIDSLIYNIRYYDSDKPLEDDGKVDIAYHVGTNDVTQSIEYPLKDLLYTQKKSKGSVVLVNMTLDPIMLLQNTEFVSDGGIVFRLMKNITIPGDKGDSPGIKYGILNADAVDINGYMIGKEGNITKGTKLYVKKLPTSTKDKKIYATANEDFVGGDIIKRTEVNSGDIEKVYQKIYQTVKQSSKSIVSEQIKGKKILIIPEKNMEDIQDEHIVFDYKIINPDQVATKGTMLATIALTVKYKYVFYEDVIKKVSDFTNAQYDQNINSIINTNNSISFLENSEADKAGVIKMPTKIDVIKGYNLLDDNNGILEEIKNKIYGLTIYNLDGNSAYNILTSYPEFVLIDIKNYPGRYKNVARLKSRIKFDVKE